MRVTRCHVENPLAVGQTLSLPEERPITWSG